MLTRALRATPKLLLLASALFFAAAYFATRFQDFPGASVGSYVSTFLIALPSSVALFRYLGARRAALSLLVLASFGFAIETTGVVTGLPYGRFYYGDALGEKVFGLVPYLLPVSYVPLVIGAVAAAWNIVGNRRVLWTLLSAVLLVLIDGVLDPGAAALGFWAWPEGGVYYGVPSSNYAGWLFSGVIASALLLAAGRPRGAPPPGMLDSTILALSFWTGVAAINALIFPAALGFALLVFFFSRRLELRGRQVGKAASGAGGV